MSYTFVKIASFYREYLNEYYFKNPEILKASYVEQYQHLMYDSFAWADFFQQNLTEMGVSAFEIIYNAKPLQNAWAKEHGSFLDDKELIVYQLRYLKPEIVFFQDSINFNGLWLDYLKSEIPSIKKVIGWCCSPFSEKQIQLFKYFDFMLTCSPALAKTLVQAGVKTYLMYHAFEPKILARIKSHSVNTSNITFLGSLIPNTDFHNYRTSVIEEILASNIKINVYAKLNMVSPLKLLPQKLLYYFIKTVLKMGYSGKLIDLPLIKKFIALKQAPKNQKYSSKLLRVVNKPLYGLEMFNTIKASKINLNIHGGIAGEYAANMRMFETTGVGTCLVTDWKKNIRDFFIDGDEVITFKSSEECVEKVKWLLNNPMELEKICLTGQKKTLEHHTFKRRAEQLDEIIKHELKKSK